MTVWDVMLKLRDDRPLVMSFTDKNGVDWIDGREAALTSWQFDGYLLLMPAVATHPHDIEVWEIRFDENKQYTTKRLI